MTSRKYLHWFSCVAAALCATVVSVSGEYCLDTMATSCTNTSFYTGCERGSWKVWCTPDGTNCVFRSSIYPTMGCYLVTAVGGSCGDCCVNIPGCGMNCVFTATNQLPVIGTMGTPSCPVSCPGLGASGSCLNSQPIPDGSTWPYYEATDHSCGS